MTDTFTRAHANTGQRDGDGAATLDAQLEALLDGVVELKDDTRMFLDPGEYLGLCVKAKFFPFYKFHGVVKLILQFCIYGLTSTMLRPEEKLGQLEMLIATPFRIDSKSKKIIRRAVSPRSKLAKAYRLVMGSEGKTRTDRMSFRMFEKKLFRVQVGTVTPLDASDAPYSVVRELVQRLA